MLFITHRYKITWILAVHRGTPTEQWGALFPLNILNIPADLKVAEIVRQQSPNTNAIDSFPGLQSDTCEDCKLFDDSENQTSS